MAELQLFSAGRTDRGIVRDHNEDKVLVDRRLWVVADGVGGHNSGELASHILISELDPLDMRVHGSVDEAEAALIAAIERANSRIRQRAQVEVEHAGMATTVTAALEVDGEVVIAQIGDTRAYLKRGDAPLRQLTPEHTYVNALVEAGVINHEAARNHPKKSVILRAVGLKDTIDVDLGERVALQPNDELILCSDGVHGVIEDAHLELLVHGQPLEQAVDAVVQAAKDGGGPDNITIAVIRAVAQE